jgi:hypothetical protein
MRLRKLHRRKTLRRQGLAGIAPIYKVSLEGEAKLIGTGFWITEAGHLISAWHVIEDNIAEDGIDRGPIYAMQSVGGGAAIPRVLRKTHKHKIFDLSLSETLVVESQNAPPTRPLPMTLDEPEVGDTIFTHAFLAPDQKFTDERYQGVSTASFDGLMAIPDLGLTYELSFKAKVGFGCLTEIFKEARDRVLLPFPCFRSDVPLYGANSGGPVFDKRGRICGVNCTSFAGEAISFHMPLKGILELGARDIEFVPEDPVPRWRTVAELGLARRVPFYPSLERIFFTRWQRLILRCYHVILDTNSWIRWWLSGPHLE